MYVLCSVIEGTNMFGTAEVQTITSMMQPAGTDVSSLQGPFSISGFYSLVTNVWEYIKIVIQAIFLYFPDLWTGNWIWFYFVVCLPISIAMIVSLVMVLRGTASS
jgi:hypothetical protein